MVGSAIGSLLCPISLLKPVIAITMVLKIVPNIFIDEALEVVNDLFIQLRNKGRGAKTL